MLTEDGGQGRCGTDDVDVAAERASFEKELDDLYGLDDVKQAAKQEFALYAFDKLYKTLGPEGGTPVRASQSYAFLGPPGTGKTTVAKLFSKMFCRLGRVNFDAVHHTRPDELIGNKVGDTQRVVNENLAKGKGGVIFIDEAYLLAADRDRGANSFQQEAIGVLMKLMDAWPRTVFIFAGYEQQMQDMFSVNSGFKRRVAKMFHFEPYKSEELASMFVAKAKRQNANLGVGFFPDTTTARLPELLQNFKKSYEPSDALAGTEVGARFLRFLQVREHDPDAHAQDAAAWDAALSAYGRELEDRVLELVKKMPEDMLKAQNAALIDRLFGRLYEIRARRIMDNELMTSREGCLPNMPAFNDYRTEFAHACPVVLFYTHDDLHRAVKAEEESWGPAPVTHSDVSDRN